MQMSETGEDSFVPQSDEDLAQLLEAQLASMRKAAPAPVTPAVRTPSVTFNPADVPEWNDDADESGIDSLFGSLLDGDPETEAVAVVTEQVVIEEIVPQAIPVEPLAVTEPFAYGAPDVIEGEEILVEETAVEEILVVEEISQHSSEDRPTDSVLEDVVVATTIAASAGAEPIPAMFSEAEYVSAVLEVEPPAPAVIASTLVVTEQLETPLVQDAPVTDVVPEQVTELAPVDEPTVDSVAVDDEPVDVAPSITAPVDPITTFSQRPSFDELVFGSLGED